MSNYEDKLMQELGYVSMHFTIYDYLINEINCILINLENDKIGGFISSKLNTQGRIELLENLLKIVSLPIELIDELNSSLAEFKKVKQKRNDLIHGVWHTKEDDDNLNIASDYYIAKFKNRDSTDAQKIDINELIEIKNRIRNLIDTSFKLILTIRIEYRESLAEERKKNEGLVTSFAKLTNSQ